jgi:hypothetical protein
MNRSLLASLLGLATAMVIVLATAAPAGAMVAAPIHPAVHRAAAIARRRVTPCHPAPKRRQGKKRKVTTCRRPTKTRGAKSTAAPPAFSTLLGSPTPGPGPPTSSTASASGPSIPEPTSPTSPPLPVPGPSAWDEPALNNPTTIELSPTNYVLSLNQNQDYILQCPSGGLTLPAALNIAGGHNVVLENCDVELSNSDWAAKFSYQSGTLWVEGVHFGGAQLTGGVQFQEPGATVVLRDILFDTVYGSQSTNHAELIQTWAGPARLLIDGLTGSTTYQGLFLLPNQDYTGPPPTVVDLRHIDIDDSQGAYALWLGDVTGSPSNDASGAILTWNVEDVYVVPNPARTWPGWWLWPQPSTGDPSWEGALAGSPPGGSYVQATSSGAAGVDEGAEPPALVGEQP